MSNQKTMDVVFATTSQTYGQMSGPKPVRSRMQLHHDVYIGLYSEKLWDEVFKVCQPAGYSFAPVPQFGQLYAFWNENPADPSGLIWDPDRSLATAVALSRLIHPTRAGFRYSARVILGFGDSIKQIIPGSVSGLLADAYVAAPTARDWLTDSDALTLGSLLTRYHTTSTALPPRVRRALWDHEYAAAIKWIDVRWTIIATALESLVHTDRFQSTRQFVNRVTALANRVGVGFSRQDSQDAYDNRSSLAHGQDLSNTDPPTTALYCRMEEVLRVAIRTAIEDDNFRDIFLDENRIRREFPL